MKRLNMSSVMRLGTVQVHGVYMDYAEKEAINKQLSNVHFYGSSTSQADWYQITKYLLMKHRGMQNAY